MQYHHIILEPTMFNCLDFIVAAETREDAMGKLRGWCNYQVEKTRVLFEGRRDQVEMVRSTRSYWDTGLQNRAFMGRVDCVSKLCAKFKPYTYIA